MFDAEWRQTTAIGIAGVEVWSEKIIDYRPVPERFREFHEGYVGVAETLVEAMDELTHGIDNIDADAVERAGALIRDATRQLNELPVEGLLEAGGLE